MPKGQDRAFAGYRDPESPERNPRVSSSPRTNIRLDLNFFPGTNALAYSVSYKHVGDCK